MSTEARTVAGGERVPWDSLAQALRLILHRHGSEIDVDVVHALLGDPWSFCAAVGDPELAQWPLYARDRFLIAVGGIVGLTIRAIHPPEAARGLRGAGEFRQHFEASYRPLILRALEHEQAVLAWRGWPGEWDAAWGILRRSSRGGVGLMGSVATAACPTLRGDAPNKGGEGESVELADPPTQVYVVERVQVRPVEFGSAISMIVDNALAALSDGLVEAHAVFTGRSAWDRWLDTLAGIDLTADGAVGAAYARAHTLLARSVVERARCAVRFLGRAEVRASVAVEGASASSPSARSLSTEGAAAGFIKRSGGTSGGRAEAAVQAWQRSCQVLVTYLSASTDEAWVVEAIGSAGGRRALRDQIETARDSATAGEQILRDAFRATIGGQLVEERRTELAREHKFP